MYFQTKGAIKMREAEFIIIRVKDTLEAVRVDSITKVFTIKIPSGSILTEINTADYRYITKEPLSEVVNRINSRVVNPNPVYWEES